MRGVGDANADYPARFEAYARLAAEKRAAEAAAREAQREHDQAIVDRVMEEDE